MNAQDRSGLSSRPRPAPQAAPSEAPPQGDAGFELPEPARPSRTRFTVLSVVVLAVLGGAFAAGYLPRHHAREALVEASRKSEAKAPRVDVITPTVAASDRALRLPGSIQPLEETLLYPRASGYVKRWLVDIGDKVKEGALLAEIETPEIEQELAQARAQLAQAEAGILQAKANREYSKANLQRYKALAPSGVASQQEVDQHQAQASVDEANVAVAEASVGAQQANIRRLQQLVSFSRITAPFAGTVTARNVERGSLVSPGGAALPLFKVAATDPVRVFVQVPQDVAPSIKDDLPAQVTVREFAGQTFDGKVSRSTGALDPSSRTMTTEVRVPNPKGQLITGMYADVALTLNTSHKVLELPSTVLFNDAKGLRVATVDAANKVHLVPVTLERDLGPTIQIATGLTGDERVIKVVSPILTEALTVDIVPR